jgi:type II secretory pathway pseudopilin PulG
MNTVRGSSGVESAAVLLEVILALALFAATAAIVTTGINSSVNSVERLRLTTHAGNLAATIISEIKLGDRSSAMTEAEPFEEPFTNWTYQVSAGTGSGTTFESAESFQQVEVVIRNVARPFEFRFGEILPVNASSPSDPTEIADDF